MFLTWKGEKLASVLALDFAVATSLILTASSCGSRTSIPMGDGEFELPCKTMAECSSDDLCKTRACVDGLCKVVSTVTCDDGDTCTTDSCVPETGQCEYVPRTRDEDGDGHRAALLGTVPGAPGSCGDDCDDTSAKAHPGAKEVCDGVDNDCNGIIDDTGTFGSPTVPTLVSDLSKNESIPASITYATNSFAMTTVQRDNRWHGYFQTVDANGAHVVAPVALTQEASDGMAGPVLWTGALYGTAWEDRRDQSYDIYFNRLDSNGRKMGPDVRVTNNPGFTVSPSLLWDGQNWLLAYSDEVGSDTFRIFARKLNYDGSSASDSIAVSDRFVDARSPRLVRTETGISLFYNAIGNGLTYVRLDSGLMPLGDAQTLSLPNAGEISVRWNGDRFMIAWSLKTDAFGSEIHAVTMDVSGRYISKPQTIAQAPTMARSPSWAAFGNRAYLVWADDFFSPGTFELSGQMFDNNLKALGSRTRLTELGADTFDPSATIGGPNIGVLFRSRNLGEWQSYFLAVKCTDGLLQ